MDSQVKQALDLYLGDTYNIHQYGKFNMYTFFRNHSFAETKIQ